MHAVVRPALVALAAPCQNQLPFEVSMTHVIFARVADVAVVVAS